MREVEEEKDEEECGDTPAGRLTHSLLMQTAQQRASTNRRRQDSREYRCVCVCVCVKVLCFMKQRVVSQFYYPESQGMTLEYFLMQVLDDFRSHLAKSG